MTLEIAVQQLSGHVAQLTKVIEAVLMQAQGNHVVHASVQPAVTHNNTGSIRSVATHSLSAEADVVHEPTTVAPVAPPTAVVEDVTPPEHKPVVETPTTDVVVTIDMLRSAAQRLAAAQTSAPVFALFKKHGGPDCKKVTEIPEANRAALYADMLAALGEA